MDLNELLAAASVQDTGHEFELLDPVEGRATGLKFTIAGPDSEKAKVARAKMETALTRINNRGSGRVTADERDRLMADFLFDVTIGWKVKQGNKALEFNRENFARVIGAGTWVRAQIDMFAADRAPYFRDGTA